LIKLFPESKFSVFDILTELSLFSVNFDSTYSVDLGKDEFSFLISELNKAIFINFDEEAESYKQAEDELLEILDRPLKKKRKKKSHKTMFRKLSKPKKISLKGKVLVCSSCKQTQEESK